MGNIKEINRPSCKLIRSEIDRALQTVREEFGLFIDIGGGTFTRDDFKLRLNITLKEGFDGKTGAEAQFERYAFQFGLPDKAFGKRFSFGGEVFTITGIRPNARKNPILGKNAKGKIYVFPADVVKVSMIN